MKPTSGISSNGCDFILNLIIYLFELMFFSLLNIDSANFIQKNHQKQNLNLIFS